MLEMWHEKLSKQDDDEPSNGKQDYIDPRCLFDTILFLVKFEIGGGDPKTPNNEQDEGPDESWECVWKCHTAAPVHHMAFSPDGTLFATSGKSDRLVKVWYENKHRKFADLLRHSSAF